MAIQPSKPARPGDLVAEISEFLAPELKTIEQILGKMIESDSPLIREVGEYVCLATGKKLRPMMTLLSARALGLSAATQPAAGAAAPPPDPVQIAAAMEAVHVATLLHDDVIDKAAMRRGRPAVNARWGDDVAILMADYLFASAFNLALCYLNNDPLSLICKVTRRMCEGEMFQIERRGRWLTTEDYEYIITCKTAYLFSACAALGAMVYGHPAESVTRLASFGLEFGLAFQITDDLLDYVAADEHWGKSVGNDLANGKQTLPLILALRDASAEDHQAIETILNDGRDMAAIRQMLSRYHSLDSALELARHHAAQARAQLEGLPVVDPVALDYLLALPEYVINRRY